MEDPVRDVEPIIHALTQSTPSIQRQTIEKYFLPHASFQHPFCRTGSFTSSSTGLNSRFLIRAIYRWYKIMSPEIKLRVNSVAYDEKNLICYVGLSQVFRIWFFPIITAPVDLVTVLRLERSEGDGLYYLRSQDDLYQVNQFVKFFAPGGHVLVWLWQMMATLGCILLAMAFWPVSWFEEHGGEVKRRKDEVVQRERQKMEGRRQRFNENVGELTEEVFERAERLGNGETVTAPTTGQ